MGGERPESRQGRVHARLTPPVETKMEPQKEGATEALWVAPGRPR